MVLIEEITNEVVSSALETALESELSAEPIQHIFRALRDEDRLVTTMALRVHQAAPITLTITPSPVRRPSQLRAHRSSSPTWIDGIYAEMVAADAERARKRSALSPPRMIEEVTTEAMAVAVKAAVKEEEEKAVDTEAVAMVAALLATEVGGKAKEEVVRVMVVEARAVEATARVEGARARVVAATVSAEVATELEGGAKVRVVVVRAVVRAAMRVALVVLKVEMAGEAVISHMSHNRSHNSTHTFHGSSRRFSIHTVRLQPDRS